MKLLIVNVSMQRGRGGVMVRRFGCAVLHDNANSSTPPVPTIAITDSGDAPLFQGKEVDDVIEIT